MLPSREWLVIHVRRDFSEFRGAQVLPFYIVCHESGSTEPVGGIVAVNETE